MRRIPLLCLFAATLAAPPALAQRPAAAGPYSLEQVLAFPFASGLVASPAGSRIAWIQAERGVRNVWVAEPPDFKPRQLTTQEAEDGQELGGLAFSGDGRHLVFVRGGDHDANWPAPGNLMPNPTGSPVQPKLEIWSVAVAGGEAKVIAEGDDPAPSPKGDRVAFVKDRQIWVAPTDGAKPAARLFFARGTSGDPVWSPDGSRLAFVSDREDQSYVALYSGEAEPIRYLAPSTSRDTSPRFSPDGKRIAFVRRPGRGGPPSPPLDPAPQPWSIWVAEVASGEARRVFESPETELGSFPRTLGNANLHWAAGERLVFLSDLDGWPHLYSVKASGGEPLLLTPGRYMVEHVTLTPDRRFAVFSANAGDDRDDIERRHLLKVPVDEATPVALTSGRGLEWGPVVTADGGVLAFLSSDPRRPPLARVRGLDNPEAQVLLAERIPAEFPTAALLSPEHVVFQAPDGTEVHGQLFKSGAGPARRPAIVFVHGGPPRQMLLGWHYMHYYANAYALNQYLASRGYVVLSVNYRLGIGYGHAFANPKGAGGRGASEYQDVLAAGKYLQGRGDVDPRRIGIWGGSYGGYLTALALGRNSDVFAAGVDIHGVHHRVSAVPDPVEAAAAVGDGIGEADLREAARVAWESSPASWVKTWRSPVLLIHGDDDRNVRFGQTVDLVVRLRKQGVPFEEIVIPDEVHDFLLHRSWVRALRATADFFDRHLLRGGAPARP